MGTIFFVRCEHTNSFELSHAVGSSALESYLVRNTPCPPEASYGRGARVACRLLALQASIRSRAPHVADRRRRLRHRSQVDLTLDGLQCATRRRCDK